MNHYQHPQAIVESKNIGVGTKVWAFAHILPGATIGADCQVCDGVFVENDVKIGDRVTIKCGVQIWDGLEIEDDVFIGPNATFTNDLHPRSKEHTEKVPRTRIRRGASIGANATILPGLNIGQKSMVGAGAVVTRDVPPYAIVMGNPANITGYTTGPRVIAKQRFMLDGLSAPGPYLLSIPGVILYRLPLIQDSRGNLSFAELGQYLPFNPKRFFLVFDVPSREVRGEHSHRECHQFLVIVKGSCSVVIDNGNMREEVLLDRPELALHVPPMIWATQYNYSSDAVLLVFASEVYDEKDYIRDYDEFQKIVGRQY